MMKKILFLFFSFLLLFSCQDGSTPQMTIDEIGLEKLAVGNVSVLEKMDEKLFYNFGEVEKYSVLLNVSPKNRDVVNLRITVNNEDVSGSIPYFRCNLKDGDNEIRIFLVSKKDESNKKIYTIKLKKKKSNTPDEESSKLKELKVDGNSIISLLDSDNVAKLPDVEKTKLNVSLDVIPHNPGAGIEVANKKGAVSIINKNKYNVGLGPGLNEIRVVIESEAEGEKLHIIKIYREEDLNLKSFNVDGTEYCENGVIKVGTIRFETEKTEAIVKVEAMLDNATITLKHDENEIIVKDGSYKIMLNVGKNEIEVIIKGSVETKTKRHKVVFMRALPHTSSGKLLILKADGKGLLHLLSKDNIATLAPCNNDKTSLKLEVKANTGITIKVVNDGTEISGDTLYDVNLKEGNNKIVVQLYSGTDLVDTYSIFIIRYPLQDVPGTPATDEVQISFVLSDGVNGSAVDGSYINIFKTKALDSTPFKRVLVRDGKAKVNLPKNEFYDFKVEGRNTDYYQTRYAASDVISYYVNENTKFVSMVQFPLQRLTRPAVAPQMKELKFGGETLQLGEVKSIGTQLDEIGIKVLSSSPIENLSWNSPKPMLAVGFVPTDDIIQDVFYAYTHGNTSKTPDGKYESGWKWYDIGGVNLIKGDEFDVIIVLYDVANNRLEYHIRFKTSDTTVEDATVVVSDLNMEFTSLPTPSRIFSIGKDEFTNNSSHYSNKLSFKVKKGYSHVSCKGFDIYRKCVEDGEDFRLVKHLLCSSLQSSSNSSNGYHVVNDNDSMLEDEKTYQYKVVAYTNDSKKSSLDASPMLSIKIPKSTSVLLTSPVNESVSLTDAQKMDYVFRLSNPKILETAKEIRMGFLISNRKGGVLYASKFKYVFDDSNGKDEIYFARLNDAKIHRGIYLGTDYSMKRSTITSKPVEDLIKIDKTTGTISFTKSFTSLTQAKLAGGGISYERGNPYYWDVLDWGVNPYSDFDDLPTKIVSRNESGVTIISDTNDDVNGNNAWNGRAEFTIRFN